MATPWNNADHARVEARRWRVLLLSNRGLTHVQIAEEMQDEYREASSNPDNLTIPGIATLVGVDIHRALKEYRKRTDKEIEERISAQLLRFDDIRRNLYGIMARRHPVLANGKIVKDDDDRPLRDDGPVLAALAQLISLEDRQARVEGTYAREKLDIALQTRVENEAQLAVEAILAGADAIGLEPVQRQRMLEAAGARLRTIDGEVVNEGEEDGS